MFISHRNVPRMRGIFLSCFVVFGFLLAFQPAYAATNLILNPDMEMADSSGLPANWVRGKWGTNNAAFQYPVSGVAGSKAGKVTITQYTSGDAKWAHKEVAITAGKEYEFSDFYSSDVQTFITLQYRMSNGTFSYLDIDQPPASSSLTERTIRFVAPANAVGVTVFHLINRVGFLTTDRYSLTEVAVTPPPPTDPNNLFTNPSLETVGSNGLPTGWTRGKWGTNTNVFIFPTAGYQSDKAARVEISSYTSGDAKWYPGNVNVTPGSAYEFSNVYKSNIKSYVAIRYTLSSGANSFVDIGAPASSVDWKQFKTQFTVPPNAVAMTVFHLIKGVGYLEVDNYSLKKISNDPTKFNNGLVSINFDDGWRSAYQNALPILDAAGFKSNQFIVTGRMNSDFPGYVQPNEVLSMQSRGHEVGAHTRTHSDLTTLTDAEARAEIQGSRNDLKAIGINPVNFFAYPFGSYDDQVQQIVKDAGFAAGRSSDGGYNDKTIDLFALRRQPMLANTTLPQVKGYIDKALTDKTWVILLFHEVNNSGNQYSVTPSFFQQTVDYLKQKSVVPVTLSQAINLINQ